MMMSARLPASEIPSVGDTHRPGAIDGAHFQALRLRHAHIGDSGVRHRSAVWKASRIWSTSTLD